MRPRGDRRPRARRLRGRARRPAPPGRRRLPAAHDRRRARARSARAPAGHRARAARASTGSASRPRSATSARCRWRSRGRASDPRADARAGDARGPVLPPDRGATAADAAAPAALAARTAPRERSLEVAMSSVAAAPRRAAALRRRRRARRPSTRTVYRWELRKLVSQKRTYLGLGARRDPAADLRGQPARAPAPRPRRRQHLRLPDHPVGARDAGADAAVRVGFFLPLIAALVAGDIVAAEDGNGTLKTILTRSVDRGQVFAAKALAALTYGDDRRVPLGRRRDGRRRRLVGLQQRATPSPARSSRRRRPAARVRRQRLLPDPAADGRQHRRAAVHRHAQQRRRGRRHARRDAPAGDRLSRSRASKASSPTC